MPQELNRQELMKALTLETSLRKLSKRIHSASIDEIFFSIRDEIENLAAADRVTIFVAQAGFLVSRYKDAEQVQEIKLLTTDASLAGYCASNRKTLRIRDCYDAAELKRIDPGLRFDSSWDRRSGFRSRNVLCVPIQLPDRIYGVIQAINKKDGSDGFTEDDERIVVEAAESLAVALKNQKQQASRPKHKYDLLYQEELLTEEKLEEAQRQARQQQCSVEFVLMDKLKIPRDKIVASISRFYGVEFVPFTQGVAPPVGLLDAFTVDYLKHYSFVPFSEEGGKVVLIMENPKDLQLRDELSQSRFPGKRVDVKVGLREDILEFIDQFYGLKKEKQEGPGAQVKEEDLKRALQELDAEAQAKEKEREKDKGKDEGPEVKEDDKGLVLLANQLIEQGYAQGASDIHIEAYPDRDVEVRFRVDGVCSHFTKVPRRFARALVSRLKIMCGLDIAERRLPQDGKIKFRNFGKFDIELRVAIIPTNNDMEDVVMRILASSKPIPLDNIGMTPINLERFKSVVSCPYGILLCVGPTGSGKTTTLHSALGFINHPDTKIWTAEDPVEITQAGLRQVQVHAKIGYTFERALRAFLRGDPDVIMIGEMRDTETASAGIEASLTGHLVLSTLHTNSAPETITRLLDLDIDPFTFGDSLLGVLAQRLARRLCKDCKEKYRPDAAELKSIAGEYGGPDPWKALGVDPATLELYRAKGCDKCRNLGYKGRVGLHELMLVDDDMRQLIYRKGKVAEIRNLAMERGMSTLKQDGLWKIVRGITDMGEVSAVSMR